MNYIKETLREYSIFARFTATPWLIAQMENVDVQSLFVIETAALTHDIGIHICEEKYGECGGKLQEKKVLLLPQDFLTAWLDSEVSEECSI